MASSNTVTEKKDVGEPYSFNVFELIFAVGHIKKTEDGSNKYSQDGYISALLLFIILTSFGITLSCGTWITKDEPFPINSIVVEIVLTIYMLIGFCFMVLMTCESTRKKVSFNAKEDTTNGQNKKTATVIKVLPLISFNVFLIGVIALDIINISSYSSCLPEYRYLQHRPNVDDEIAHKASVKVVYHIVRCTFCTFMSLFCCFCINANVVFYRRWYLRFGITVLLSSLMWIWFESQVTESKEIFNPTEESPFCVNMTTEDDHSNRTLLCLCKDTTSFQVYEESSNYLFPLVTEYCLIVAECILDMFFHMKDSEGNGTTNGK